MKRITFLMLMVASVAVYAQKQPKPNLNKAVTAFREKKLAEAKEIVDAATTYEKTMNDGKTWYYRGLVYAALDTTSNEQFKSLEAEPLKVAIESFAKADELSDKKTEYTLPGGTLDLSLQNTKPVQVEGLANYYLDKGINKVQNEDDFAGGLKYFEKSKQLFEAQLPNYPNDTLAYYLIGYTASQSEDFDKADENLDKYFAKGGKSKDAYLIKYQMYASGGAKEDKEKALKIIQEAKTKQPSYTDFAKIELGLLIDLNKVDEAKAGLQKAIEGDPNNKTYHFYLGYLNMQQGNIEEARKSFANAAKADPEYFDAQYFYANTFLVPIDKLSKQINDLGITPADSKKKQELAQKRVKEAETALPLLEKIEKMKMPDQDTEVELLNKLKLLYYYVGDDKNGARVEKRLKALGQD
jgi:tetratricopeptide (TPR) repeat protein